jgi:uncharacterized membrane protein
MPLDVTLTDEERDRWIQRMAEEVARRRLEVPAVLLLEMHRPLTFLASQALVVSTPFLGALVGPDNVLNRANLDRLLERIEALVSERDAHSSPAEAPASGQ